MGTAGVPLRTDCAWMAVRERPAFFLHSFCKLSMLLLNCKGSTSLSAYTHMVEQLQQGTEQESFSMERKQALGQVAQ